MPRRVPARALASMFPKHGFQGAFMKIALRVLCGLLLAVTSHAVLAQSRLTVSQALDFWITATEQNVVPAADAMPEEKYSFAPSNGEFTGVRTFAQQVSTWPP